MVSDTNQEKVWFAREVFQLFVKAFTNLKLYPHHHVHAQTAVGAFVDRVRSFVSLHGVLRLSVGQDTFSVGEDVVYEEENRNENLAFRLYGDGLRELSINPGVTREEAERLFAALSEGGEVSMPLQVMFWGGYYGAFTDKFGISWMMNCESKT